jgi:hypothetical protein
MGKPRRCCRDCQGPIGRSPQPLVPHRELFPPAAEGDVCRAAGTWRNHHGFIGLNQFRPAKRANP